MPEFRSNKGQFVHGAVKANPDLQQDASIASLQRQIAELRQRVAMLEQDGIMPIVRQEMSNGGASRAWFENEVVSALYNKLRPEAELRPEFAPLWGHVSPIVTICGLILCIICTSFLDYVKRWVEFNSPVRIKS